MFLGLERKNRKFQSKHINLSIINPGRSLRRRPWVSSQRNEVYIAFVILRQSMQAAKLLRAMLTVITQHFGFLLTHGALPGTFLFILWSGKYSLFGT